MALETKANRARRDRNRELRARAKQSRLADPVEHVEALSSLTVWRASDLPSPRSASVGVPLSEGISSVFVGAIAYVPVALVTGYAGWNYPVAALLVLGLSYALFSRRVVVGPDFMAIRKFGPYRLASTDSITSFALQPSQRGGVLKLRTGDGRTMRLRRVEFSDPSVNNALRALMLKTGRRYDSGVMTLLDLPWRGDFGHHRYLLDAIQ